jgi:hypothetical protein
MSNVRDMVASYLAARNERDASRRRELVARTWTEDGTYIDAQGGGIGHQGIDSLLATTQEQYPGHRVWLVGRVEAHNGCVRFSWAAHGDSPVDLQGTDFAILGDDGRFESVAGFVNAPPGAERRS